MRILKLPILICTSFILSFKIAQTFAAFRHFYSVPKICSNHFVIYESCFLCHQSIMYAHELMCLKLPQILNEWFCFMQPRCVAQLDITRPHQRKVLCEAWMIFLQWTQGVKPVNMCRHHYLELTLVPTKTHSQGVLDDILLFHLNRTRLR